MKHTTRIFSAILAVFVMGFLASCQQSATPNAGGKVMPLDISNWGGDGNAGTADLVTLTGTGGTVTGGSFTVTGATYEDQSGTTLIPSGEGKTEIEVAVDGNGHMTSTASAVDWVSVTGGSDNNGGDPITWTINTDTMTSGTYGFRAHFINSGGRNGGDYKENKTGGEDVTLSLCTDVVTGPLMEYGVLPWSLGSGSWNSNSYGWSDQTANASWNDNAKWTRTFNANTSSTKAYNYAFNLEQFSYSNHTCPNDHWVLNSDNGEYTGTLYISLSPTGPWTTQPIAWGTGGDDYYEINGNNNHGFGSLSVPATYTVYYSTDGSSSAGSFLMALSH